MAKEKVLGYFMFVAMASVVITYLHWSTWFLLLLISFVSSRWIVRKIYRLEASFLCHDKWYMKDGHLVSIYTGYTVCGDKVAIYDSFCEKCVNMARKS